MRLFNLSTLTLEEFVGKTPPYAILSHTWGEKEVLFEDRLELKIKLKVTGLIKKKKGKKAGLTAKTTGGLAVNTASGGEGEAWNSGETIVKETHSHPGIPKEEPKKNYKKVTECCQLAHSEGYNYVWIDTFCIDKSSSAELSEAINSMFDYYRRSAVCYVYLEDIKRIKINGLRDTGDLSNARWTSRGWTLQELIAPNGVKFYDRFWKFCGTREDLAERLNRATNIDISILRRAEGHSLDLDRFSIAQRMSWAVNRQTKRPEDIAYCLLGLFDVHIPLLYGEGQEKAFFRLQREILKYSLDHSILAWWHDKTIKEPTPKDTPGLGVLAKSPADFARSADVVPYEADSEPSEMTNKGLRVTLRVIGARKVGSLDVVLHCRYKDNTDASLCLRLVEAGDGTAKGSKVYHRLDGFVRGSWEDTRRSNLETLYLSRTAPVPIRTTLEGYCFWFRFNYSATWKKLDIGQWTLGDHSAGVWDEATRKLRLGPQDNGTAEFSAWLFEGFGTTAPTERSSVRFAIRKQDIFHCTTQMIFPSYTCGFEEFAGEELSDSFEVDRSHEYNIRATMNRIPDRMMGEYVYEINFDFDIGPMSGGFRLIP